MDLQATLLELAAHVETERKWWLQASAAYIKHDWTPEQQAEIKSMLDDANSARRHRVEEIRTLAAECPAGVRAKLFHASTKLATSSGDDVPALLSEAAAELQGERTPADSKADSTEKNPISERVLRAIKYVNDYNKKVAQGKANKIPRNAILSMHLGKPVESKAVKNLDRQLRNYRHRLRESADS